MEIGQGHGIAGRFAGLPDPYGRKEFAKIAILPIPFDKTSTYKSGSDRGPEALIEASRNLELYDIETDSQVYQLGIYTEQPILSQTSEEMIRDGYQKVKQLLKSDKFTVTLGGEHTISFAPIKAHAEHYGKLTILQLDAHSDLQPAYENNPWSHASVMSRVKELPEVSKIVSVGIRSMSHEELPYLDRANIFFAHQLEGPWIERVLDALSGPVYITFDLDVFDSSLMPSTGTPEPGGLYWQQCMSLLSQVMQKKNVTGFDVVELCPNPSNAAPDYLAAKLVYKMLSYKFKVDL